MRISSDPLNMFPLSKINPRLDGYFMARDGSIYSTRRYPLPELLNGSRQSGRVYFTLGGRSYKHQTLWLTAQRHSDWESETCWPELEAPMVLAAAKVIGPPPAREPARVKNSIARSLDEGIRSRGVVIARVVVRDGQERLVFPANPAMHLTEDSYQGVMKRLAASEPGVEFVALKVLKSVKSEGLVWK